MDTPIDAAIDPARSRADRIIAAVCRQLQIDEAHLRSRRREPEIAAARQLTCHVLARAGYSIAQVGRLLGRDHSTVLHAVRRVATCAPLAEQGQELVETILPFVGEAGDEWPAYRLPIEALPRALLRALWGTCPLADVRAVRAYVLGALLGRERAPAARAAWGLWVVASRPAARAAVESVLRAGGLGAYGELIALQLAHAGVRVA